MMPCKTRTMEKYDDYIIREWNVSGNIQRVRVGGGNKTSIFDGTEKSVREGEEAIGRVSCFGEYLSVTIIYIRVYGSSRIAGAAVGYR